jgi:hypothetical protein
MMARKSIHTVAGPLLVASSLLALGMQLIQIRIAAACRNAIAAGQTLDTSLRWFAAMPWGATAVFISIAVLAIGYACHITRWRMAYTYLAILALCCSLILV